VKYYDVNDATGETEVYPLFYLKDGKFYRWSDFFCHKNTLVPGGDVVHLVCYWNEMDKEENQ